MNSLKYKSFATSYAFLLLNLRSTDCPIFSIKWHGCTILSTWITAALWWSWQIECETCHIWEERPGGLKGVNHSTQARALEYAPNWWGRVKIAQTWATHTPAIRLLSKMTTEKPRKKNTLKSMQMWRARPVSYQCHVKLGWGTRFPAWWQFFWSYSDAP
jgi:hypothetical protein